MLLEECKYVVKERKTSSKFIIDDREIFSDDSDREKNTRTFLILGVESSISQNMKHFCFLGFASLPRRYKSFLSLGLESCFSGNIRKTFFGKIYKNF